MKEEALVTTIDFGRNHFSVIHLNGELKLISSNNYMLTIGDSPDLTSYVENINVLNRLVNFFKP